MAELHDYATVGRPANPAPREQIRPSSRSTGPDTTQQAADVSIESSAGGPRPRSPNQPGERYDELRIPPVSQIGHGLCGRMRSHVGQVGHH